MPEQTQQKPPDIREIMADYDKAVKFFHETPAEAWEDISARNAIANYSKALQIAGYKKFLQKTNKSLIKVDSIQDLKSLPIMDKANYINAYDFNEINFANAGQNLYSFSLSSGTTNIPTVWPRDYNFETFLHFPLDVLFRQYWQIDKKSTLMIISLTMGSWTAGFLMYNGMRPLTQKYNFTLATCGSDLDNIIFTIKKFSRFYDQVAIMGYTTFVRTILEQIELEKIDIKKLNLKLFIGGEGHPVEWKQYINKCICGNAEDLTSIIDSYGTSEAGMLGFGTALTSLVRYLSYKDPELKTDLFGEVDCIPTVMQYNPANAYLEEIEGEIVITTQNTAPLVRYNIHDRGGIIPFRRLEQILKKHGYDYLNLLKEKGIPVEMIWQQPLVYLFGRREDTISVAAAIVYPEEIEPVLLNDKVKDVHSFKLASVYDDKMRQIFKIYIELRNGITYNQLKQIKMKRKYHGLIVDHLITNNIDYADAYKMDKKVSDPVIEIYNFAEGPFLKDKSSVKPTLTVK